MKVGLAYPVKSQATFNGEAPGRMPPQPPASLVQAQDSFISAAPVDLRFGLSDENTPAHFAVQRIASRYGLAPGVVNHLPPESPLHQKVLDIALIEEFRRSRGIQLPPPGSVIHSVVWNGEDLHPNVLQGVLGKHITAQKDTFGPTPAKLAERIVQAADLKPFHRIADLCAGQGNLTVAAIKKILGADVEPNFPEVRSLQSQIDVVERNPVLRETLQKQGFNLQAAPGVLEYKLDIPIYDRILMVPPGGPLGVILAKHAFDNLLKPGGKMTLLMAESMFHPEENPEKKWVNPLTGKQYSEEWLDFLHNDPMTVQWQLVSGQELLAKSKVMSEKNTRLVVLEKSREVHLKDSSTH